MVPAPERAPLTFDLDVDVCVIGGGLAGLTTAREIARRGWSVAVLETHRIAWNASGRNNGFVLPGFAELMERIVARVGLDHAKALWALSEMGLEYVRTTIAEARMPGVAPVERLAQGRPRSTTARRHARCAAALRRGARRRRSRAGRASACARCSRPITISTRSICRARSTSIRSTTRSGSRRRPRSGGRAHLRGDAGAGDRRRRRAQAHHHAIGARARQPHRARRQCPSRRR